MRPSTQIYQRTAAINSGQTSLGNFRLNQFFFEWIVLEQLEGLLFGNNYSLKRLLFLDIFFYLIFYFIVLCLSNYRVSNIWVIEKPMFSMRTMAQPCTIYIFNSLPKKMRTRVPEYLFADPIFKSNEFQLTISFKRSINVNNFVLIIGRPAMLLRLNTCKTSTQRGFIFVCILNFRY